LRFARTKSPAQSKARRLFRSFLALRKSPPRIPTGFHHSAQGCELASYPG
jgi:hypothetical protein